MTNTIVSLSTESGYNPSLLEQVKNLELKGVKHAGANRIDDALVCFNQAIEILPEYAAGYNNRAQARRIKGMNQGRLSVLYISCAILTIQNVFLHLLIR